MAQNHDNPVNTSIDGNSRCSSRTKMYYRFLCDCSRGNFFTNFCQHDGRKWDRNINLTIGIHPKTMGFNTNMTSMVTFWMMGTPILRKLLRDDRRRDGQRPSDALQMRPLKNTTGSLGTARPPFWRSWISYFIDMLQIQSHESHK